MKRIIAKKTLRNYEKKEWSQALLKPIRKNTDIENATAEKKTIFEYNSTNAYLKFLTTF